MSKVRLLKHSGWYFTLRLHKYWRICFKASHLFYTKCSNNQCKVVVKLHGVFSSWHDQTASLPPMHVHRGHRRDSIHMITPFVRVWTYQTRNFAQYVSFVSPQRSDSILSISRLWRLVVEDSKLGLVFPADFLHWSNCYYSYKYYT